MARKRIGEILIEAGIIDQDQLKRALTYQRESLTPTKLGEALVALRFLTEVRLFQVLSRILNLPLIDLKQVQIGEELIGLVPYSIAKDNEIVPLKIVEHQKRKYLCIAIADPTHVETIDMLQYKTGMTVKPYLAPPSHIRRAIQEAYRRGNEEIQLNNPEEGTGAVMIMRGASQGVEEVWHSGKKRPPTESAAIDLPPPVEQTKAFRIDAPDGPVALGGARVVVVSGIEAGKQYQLQPLGEVIIGRGSDVAISIKDDHLSRKHAKLVSTPNQGVWVMDLNSLNGTHVNGERVTKQRLLEGDLIQIGNNVLKVTFV